jgi:hypothetical protein
MDYSADVINQFHPFYMIRQPLVFWYRGSKLTFKKVVMEESIRISLSTKDEVIASLLPLYFPEELWGLKDLIGSSSFERLKRSNLILEKFPMISFYGNLVQQLLAINNPKAKASENIVALLIDSFWNVLGYAFKNKELHAEIIVLSKFEQQIKNDKKM